MSDLISREQAINRQDSIDAIEAKEANEFGNYMEYNVAFNDGLRSAVFALEELPSAEPEHKKGEWVDFTMYDKAATQELCGACGTWSLGMAKNFCPNCGADMREDDNSES